MTSRLNRDRLDRELLVRGWTAADLARAARVSATTISGARQGRYVSARTLRRLAKALSDAPVIAGLEDLVA